MTHQQNKQFNTYKEGLDFKVLRLAKRLRRLPAGVLYEAREAARDRARRDARGDWRVV